MSRLWRLLIILLGLGPAFVPLRAEVFPLDIGRLGLQSGMLDVARDAAFQNILVTIRIGDKQEYLINLPETAVYHIRVRRQQKLVWQETILVLLNDSDGTRIPRLDWPRMPGAVEYRLWLFRYPAGPRWLQTQELAVLLKKIGKPWLVRVRGVTARGDFIPIPELQFQWAPAHEYKKGPVPPAQKDPDLIVDPNSPDDDQLVYEPEDKDLLSGPDDGPMGIFIARPVSVDLPAIKRNHEVVVWLRYLRETFRIDKKDRFSVGSSGLGMGAAGRYYPAPNLVLSGAVDTHATRTDYGAGGKEAPNSEQKRIRLHLALGLDLLNTHIRTTDWSFNLGPALGLVQMPLQENDQKFTDYGLHIAARHHPTRLDLTVLFLKSGSREIHGSWIAPWTAWSMKPFFGTYLYNTRQSAGAVTGRFEESGLRIGLERDF